MTGSETDYVYFIKDELGRTKIGYSNDPSKRVQEIDSHTSLDISLMGRVETYQPRKLEAFLHKKFSDRRLKKEWFDLTPIDEQFVGDLIGLKPLTVEALLDKEELYLDENTIEKQRLNNVIF